MKSRYFIYLLTIFLLHSASSYAESDTYTTGKDWLQKMSKGEKFISVYAPMILLHRYGVNFRKSPSEYAQTIDKVLLDNPYLEKEDVANIFASTVYAYEPESRSAFRLIETEVANPEFSSSLLIKADPPSETSPTVKK